MNTVLQSPEFSLFLTLILKAVLTAVVPALTVIVGRFLLAKLNTLKLNIGATKWAFLSGAVVEGVKAAEQAGLAGLLEELAMNKKDYAIQASQAFLKQLGLSVPVDVLEALIEAKVLEGVHKFEEEESEAGLGFSVPR